MARKVVKKTVSKGERLGWTPLDKVKPVTLSSIVVIGKRVSATRHSRIIPESQHGEITFLIP